MPPKVNEEVQVFNLEKFSIAQLPEFQAKKEEIGSVIALNPIVEIIDNSTYELAKKSRTAVKTLRTGLEKEQADVKRKIKKNILDVVDGEYELLVSDVKKEEGIRQDPITIYEAEIEAKRQEKARLEQQRIENIKKELDDYVAEWKIAFNIMSFDSIEKVSADFLESYTTYDTTILQEFEALFPNKIEELTQYLSDKTSSLTNAENARLEKLRLEEEAIKFAKEKAEFEANQKAILAENKRIQDELEAEQKKIAEENLRISQENERKSKEIAEAQAKLDSNKKEKEEADRLAELNAIKVTETPLPEPAVIADGYSTSETPQPEKVEVAEILAPEIPTANVCYDLPKEITWDSIEIDFKNSGEKSYSKWLKSNYNVPTKIQS
jgi:colicin import membrane protein